MARIRSIKPQFWASEQVVDCSIPARLLFIGLWNFCDDYCVHPASVARLKMQVFPGDSFTNSEVRIFVDELLEVGLLREYEVRGVRYWCVPTWDRHQRPENKAGQYPLPNGTIGKKTGRKSAEKSPSGQQPVNDSSPTGQRSVNDSSPSGQQPVTHGYGSGYGSGGKPPSQGDKPPSQGGGMYTTSTTECVHGGGGEKSGGFATPAEGGAA